jgi:YD repeat-containing protein
MQRLLVFVVLLAVPTARVAVANETTTYDYDALGRLITVTKDDGTLVDYDYDAAGNRQSKDTRLAGEPPPPPPPNDPPNAADDSVLVPGVYESAFKNLVANDTDPNGDPLTIASVTQPWNGQVSIVSSTSVDVLGTAAGTGTFSYTISDGNGGTDTATVTVSVRSWGGDPR